MPTSCVKPLTAVSARTLPLDGGRWEPGRPAEAGRGMRRTSLQIARSGLANEVVRRHSEAETLVKAASVDAPEVAHDLDCLRPVARGGVEGDANQLLTDAPGTVALV